MREQISLARATKNLMLQEPFYGIFLMSLNKVWDDKVKTAGVSKRGIGFQLTISPEFWNTLSENQMKGILKHELLHIAFQHITMRDAKYPDFKLFNIAADMEINQYIDADWLPEGGVDINKYRAKGLMLEYKAGTDYYYRMLKKDEEQNGPGSDLTQQYKGDGDCHSTWKEFDELSDTEKKMINKQSEYQLTNAAQAIKGRGIIPGEFKEILDRILNPPPPKFDWRGYLRQFAGGGTQIYTKKLRRKLNKRYSSMPGLKIKPKRHVLVAIDTSASVSTEELHEFFIEIEHINRTGTDITVLQCDTRIVDISPYKKGCELDIKGRGGTDFTPAVDWFNENAAKFSAMIYLTDGEAPNPETPPRKRTLWVMSSKSSMNNKLPGHCIKLN